MKLMDAVSLFARFVVGGTFVASGTLKLLAPRENFEAAIRAFQLVPTFLEHPLALVLPWLELFAGAFCVLGLYTRAAAMALFLMLSAFTAALIWVVARDIPLDHCGCFGKWDFLVSPRQVLLRDIVLLLLTLPLLQRQRFPFSLEHQAHRRR